MLMVGLLALADPGEGTVVGWGDNSAGQSTVPPGLNGILAMAAGYAHSLLLKEDGTVIAWGDNIVGQSTVPSGLSGVIFNLI
jgi:alpha-tubulin suppressor-like RCC1 family protein